MSNLRLWLNALKSGKYKINTSSLMLKRDDGSFSIPGLASDLYIKLTKKSSWDGYSHFTETGNNADFPITVLKWLGISDLATSNIEDNATLTCLALLQGPLKQVIGKIEMALKEAGRL